MITLVKIAIAVSIIRSIVSWDFGVEKTGDIITINWKKEGTEDIQRYELSAESFKLAVKDEANLSNSGTYIFLIDGSNLPGNLSNNFHRDDYVVPYMEITGNGDVPKPLICEMPMPTPNDVYCYYNFIAQEYERSRLLIVLEKGTISFILVIREATISKKLDANGQSMGFEAICNQHLDIFYQKKKDILTHILKNEKSQSVYESFTIDFKDGCEIKGGETEKVPDKEKLNMGFQFEDQTVETFIQSTPEMVIKRGGLGVTIGKNPVPDIKQSISHVDKEKANTGFQFEDQTVETFIQTTPEMVIKRGGLGEVIGKKPAQDIKQSIPHVHKENIAKNTELVQTPINKINESIRELLIL